ncbi:sortase B protein-sorting domain-containing protein [Loktanella agnita]
MAFKQPEIHEVPRHNAVPKFNPKTSSASQIGLFMVLPNPRREYWPFSH